MLLRNASLSDLNGPSGNPPDSGDTPCERVNPGKVDAEFCRVCGAECPERVE